jgi:hypothetical protein
MFALVQNLILNDEVWKGAVIMQCMSHGKQYNVSPILRVYRIWYQNDSMSDHLVLGKRPALVVLLDFISLSVDCMYIIAKIMQPSTSNPIALGRWHLLSWQLVLVSS